MKRFPLSILFLAATGALPAFAQAPSPQLPARWVPAGTYALSDFANNKEREKTYWGTSREKGRIATFLPGMTILYQPKKSNDPNRSQYVDAITQSGIPVSVMESEISSGDFSQRSTRDVVIHHDHLACKVSGCDDEKVSVGIGFSFSILHEDENEITLGNTDEFRVTYTRSEFEDLEVKGVLTRHKGKIYPIWAVHDGYAGGLSATCGEVKAKYSKITVPADAYESDPATWKPNDDAWSLKAIESMNLGSVQKQGSNYVGSIDGPIDGQTLAVDITMFAYRNTQDWSPGFYKFAGIVSKVLCTEPPIGKPVPSFVKEAIVFFDKEPDQTINIPLREYKLTPQMSEIARTRIFDLVGRSLFYSINSPGDYERVFGQISDHIKNPSVVSYIIARLNASCRKQERSQCREKAAELPTQ
jgi:hypothetical protein